MKQQKHNYHFHDPNTQAAAAHFILQICMEADAAKIEQALTAAVPTDQPADRPKT